MMFRKLYWVVEELSAQQGSTVQGIYTSIPHLLEHGLSPGDNLRRLRLTITRLDCSHGSLGVWEASNFHSMAEDLKDFVRTEDINEEHRQAMRSWVDSCAQVAA